MFHIISNSSIGPMDHEADQHIIHPDTKYIILAGNVSQSNKRAMLYAEKLAKLYQNSYIIFNHGVFESYRGLYDRIIDGFELHINEFKKSPENLYFPKGKCIGDYDFYCTIGWPTINNNVNFQDSYFAQSLFTAMDESIYIEDQLMSTHYHRLFVLENLVKESEEEKIRVKEWLATDLGKPKILISALGDQSSSYVGESTYSTFEGIDLSGITWICGGDYDFVSTYRNANVICLPGRERSRYISEETMNLIP